MVSSFTPNKLLEMPAHGDQLGTWGTPVNSNMDIIDASFGGVATVAFSSGSSPTLVLSSAQYKNVFLRFTGPLPSNIAVTMPSVGSIYTIINDCTNSSAFILTMATTAAGGQAIGLPPGTMTDIFTDGTHAKFRALPHVGTYWDHAGSSIPAWLSACTVPPWLYCNGGTFSSATYPALATLFGSTTLPDHRGRYLFNLNDGSSLLTSSQGGINGNILFATGTGVVTTTLSSQNLPNVSWPITDNGHAHTNTTNATAGSYSWSPNNITVSYITAATITMGAAFTGISVNSGGSNTAFPHIQPATVQGIRFVRAA